MAEPGKTFTELFDDNPDPTDLDFSDILVAYDRSAGEVYGNELGHVADKVFTHATFGQLQTQVTANTNAILLLGGGGGPVDPPPDPGTITVDPFTFNGPDDAAIPSPWVTSGAGTAVIKSAAAYQKVNAATNAELITAITDLSALPQFTGYPGTSYKVMFQRSIDALFGTLGVITRFRYNLGNGSRYELKHAPGANAWVVQKFTAGGLFAGTVASGTYTYALGRLTHEALVVGNKLSIRWWPTSGGTPPTTWQITDLVMDANLTNTGFAMVLYADSGGATATDAQRSSTFDEVGFLPVAEPVDTSGGGGTTTNGAFTTVGADIRTPEGYKFYGVGVNGYPRNRVSIGGADTGYWVGDSTHYPLDGHITGTNSAQSFGFNMIRVCSAQSLSSPGASGNSQNNQSYGHLTLADECIAAGIVAIGPPIWSYTNSNKNPSGATVVANPLIQYMDDWVARYKPGGTYTGVNSYAANTIGTHAAGGSPYAWLNPLNEPWDYSNAAGWVSTGTTLYNRAYGNGWRGIFVWEAMGWGNYIGAVNSGDATVAASMTDFLSGKSNCVIGWHNYGGTDAENDLALSKMQSLGIPVIVGETGAPWDESLTGQPDNGPTTTSMRTARAYAFSRAWSYGAPGYNFWLGGAWNGYWSTPRVNSGPYWDTTKALSISGQNLMSLAANKPAPKAV